MYFEAIFPKKAKKCKEEEFILGAVETFVVLCFIKVLTRI